LIDIHSHILPDIDDGARDAETAVVLLKEMKKQGIKKVFATPHFYPNEISLEGFLSQREKSFDELKCQAQGQNLPEVILGCELLYFRNMGKSDVLHSLTLGNSNHLLIEFADGKITDSVLEDLKNIYDLSGITPVIAHIERYMFFKGFKKLLKFVSNGENHCLAQVNAESVVNKASSIKVLKMIKKGYISFVASDTHSLERRPTLMEPAFEIITKRLGEEKAKELIKNSERLGIT